MIREIKKNLICSFKKNFKGFTLLAVVFLSGFCLSFFLNISSGYEEVKAYINDFVSNVKNCSIDASETFQLVMLGYVKQIVFFLFMSLMVFGSGGCLIYTFIKGFFYGSVFFVVGNAFGIKFVTCFMFFLIPRLLINVPCFSLYVLFCIKNSFAIARGAKVTTARFHFFNPFMYAIFSLMALNISAFVQAFLEPMFFLMIEL